MARQDVPPGYTYNPKTRGAVNLATGEQISRRQVEKLRIARESGTSGSFEAKARKNKLLAPTPGVQLPRKLKRPHSLHGYRVHTFYEVLAVIANLPKGAQVYVKALGRSKQVNYRGKKRQTLIWFSLSSMFRAGDILREYPAMAATASQFYDIRAYDIIVRTIEP